MDEMVLEIAEAIYQLGNSMRMQQYAKPHRPREKMVLMFIAKGVHLHDGKITPSQLAAHLRVSGPFITQALNTLEDEGYIQRSMSKNDRRITEIGLTEKGGQFVRQNFQEYHSPLIYLVDQLGREQARELLLLLTRSTDILTEYAKQHLAEKECSL
jgi:DNA-binding MarR family transcriptional regulator